MNKQLIRLNKVNDELIGEPLELSKKEQETLSQYIKLRDLYLKLQWLEEQESEHTVECRKELNEQYQIFCQLYGRMSATRRGVKKLVSQDVYGFLVMSSLEVKINNEFQDATVLTRSHKGEIEVIRTDDCTEAMSYCLGMYGKVDIEKISEITDKEISECVRELGDLIYYSPIDHKWVTASEWLSGNVYKKMCDTKEILAELEKEPVEEIEEIYNTKLEYKHPKPWGRKWK